MSKASDRWCCKICKIEIDNCNVYLHALQRHFVRFDFFEMFFFVRSARDFQFWIKGFEILFSISAAVEIFCLT